MDSDDPQASRASFTTNEASIAKDWQTITSQFVPYAKSLPDRILDHLRLLDGDFGGFPVDRLTHLPRVRIATGAMRNM